MQIQETAHPSASVEPVVELSIKQLMTVSFSCIAYLRCLFPDDCFTDLQIATLKLKKLKINAKTTPFIGWINSCTDAIQRKYLKSLILAIYLDSHKRDNVVETYTFDFRKNVSRFNIRRLIKSLCAIVQDFRSLPNVKFVTLKMVYNKDTPAGYSPEGFVKAGNHQFQFINDPMVMQIGNKSLENLTVKIQSLFGVDERKRGENACENPRLCKAMADYGKGIKNDDKENGKTVNDKENSKTFNGKENDKTVNDKENGKTVNDKENGKTVNDKENGKTVNDKEFNYKNVMSIKDNGKAVKNKGVMVINSQNNGKTVNDNKKNKDNVKSMGGGVLNNVNDQSPDYLMPKIPETSTEPKKQTFSETSVNVFKNKNNFECKMGEIKKNNKIHKQNKKNLLDTKASNDKRTRFKRDMSRNDKDALKNNIEIKNDEGADIKSQLISFNADTQDITNMLKPNNDGIRCICTINFSDLDMLQCDKCQFWLHTVCCGFFSNEDKRIKDEYFCRICTSKNRRDLLINRNDALFRRALSIVFNEDLQNSVWLSQRMGISIPLSDKIINKFVREGFVRRNNSRKNDMNHEDYEYEEHDYHEYEVVKDKNTKENLKKYFSVIISTGSRSSLPEKDIKCEFEDDS